LSGPEVDAAADAHRDRARAFRLEYATIVWTVLEGVFALVAGILAGSVSLIAFGLDSSVEVFASAVVVWELRGADRRGERRALRAIGAAYIVVAVYVLVQALNALRLAERPESSPVGMVLLAATVAVMFGLGLAKLRVGRRMDSPTVIADGRFSLVDGSLAGAVLLGLVLIAAFDWWWADAVLAIVISLLAFYEGVKALRGGDVGPD
jgi:divalent metal cation (Fe/Co/Zn/Cd) transporter